MPNELNPNASADPYAGGTAPNGKEIYSPDEAANNLIRDGYTWLENNYGEAGDSVLSYGFWTADELFQSYYVNTAGTTAFDEAFYGANYGLFESFTTAQQTAAAAALETWDDLITLDFEPESDVQDADITFGATLMDPAAGAYAYYPSGDVDDAFYAQFGFAEAGRRSGDVWINWFHNSPTGEDGFLPRDPSTSFSILDPGSYGHFALTHELGHSLGLAHGGEYNATDDNDGDGEPDPITYEGDAYFFQDSHQYTIMSYFEGEVTGAGWVDWRTLTFRMPSTPMVHDILAVQALYGAETTTRTGDTVYGFNSNAGNPIYDFTSNTAPVLTIWDAGGNDTLDLSGWDSDSLININEGAFSSASAGASLDYLKSIGFLPEDYTQAELETFFASYNSGSQGQMTDNIAISYGAQIENAIGGGGDDEIIGNALDNRLLGNDGDDNLIGGIGNDFLVGGDGTDVFSLGAGDDIIVAQVTDSKVGLKGPNKGDMSVDIVVDFNADGDDSIDLTGFDQMFTFGGTDANKDAGDLTFKTFDSVAGAENALGFDIDGHGGVSNLSGPVTVVYGNIDGGSADFALILLNTSGVTPDDFLFP